MEDLYIYIYVYLLVIGSVRLGFNLHVCCIIIMATYTDVP